MKEHVSVMQVRKRLGAILNRVDLLHEEFVIERRGKPLAALVPADKAKRLEDAARRAALEMLRRPPVKATSEEEADRISVEAKRWARRLKPG